MQAPWTIDLGNGPVIATAIHDGHDMRPAIAAATALDDVARTREEDPATGAWTGVGDTRVVVRRSRFEVDLNRPREKAVYRVPADAWGLELWKRPLSDAEVEESLALHDRFYARMDEVISSVIARHGYFLLLDLHSYNHRRNGPGAPVDDPAANPEVNVGTGSLDREVWGSVVDAFIGGLSAREGPNGPLDVRENVRFQGGQLSRWANARFAGKGCALAVEVKKIYMDEWTGNVDQAVVSMIGDALASVVPATLTGVASVARELKPSA